MPLLDAILGGEVEIQTLSGRGTFRIHPETQNGKTFRLAGQGMFLRNPADPRDRETPDPPQPKDEFVLRFVKP